MVAGYVGITWYNTQWVLGRAKHDEMMSDFQPLKEQTNSLFEFRYASICMNEGNTQRK